MVVDVRADARSTVQTFVTGLLDGDVQAVAGLCSADVQWWVPLQHRDLADPAEVGRMLCGLLAGLSSVEVHAVAVAEDGSSAVVELFGSLRPQDGRSTFITSVLTLLGRRVVWGRTYIDVEALAGTQVRP